MHLWRYRGGYPALTEVMNKLRQNKVMPDETVFGFTHYLTRHLNVSLGLSSLNTAVMLPVQEFMDYRTERGKMLLSRRNQLLLEFSFWNEPVPREGSNIYELRSYQLRVTLSLV